MNNPTNSNKQKNLQKYLLQYFSKQDTYNYPTKYKATLLPLSALPKDTIMRTFPEALQSYIKTFLCYQIALDMLLTCRFVALENDHMCVFLFSILAG